MPILLMLNLKGGVAKTTNAVALAECFAADGRRSLLIDADHQCMAGELLLGETSLLKADKAKVTLYDLLAAMLDDEFEPRQFDKHVLRRSSNIGGGLPHLSVMPCSMRIEDFSTNMARAKRGYRSNEEFLQLLRRRRQQLRRWLQTNYDVVLVDCPPSLSLQVKFFLSVADGYIIPCVPDRLSVRGSLYLLNRIGTLGFNIRPVGTLWSLFREQNHVHREVVAKTKRKDKPLDRLPAPFDTIIPNATAIADSTDSDKTHSTFRKKYTPQFAKLYENVCLEIDRRTQWEPTEAVAETAVL